MAHDPWLDSLRKRPAFTKLLRRAEARHQEALAAFERLGGDKVLGIALSTPMDSSEISGSDLPGGHG